MVGEGRRSKGAYCYDYSFSPFLALTQERAIVSFYHRMTAVLQCHIFSIRIQIQDPDTNYTDLATDPTIFQTLLVRGLS